MDPAAGRSNWNYQVCRIEAEQGFQPDTISTDLTFPGRATSVIASPRRWPLHGLRLQPEPGGPDDDVESRKGAPAGRPDRGDQGRDYEADLTVDDVKGRWRFVDTSGSAFTGEHAFVPVQTVRPAR